uniref:Uncharacterized protein n=1 Tax=Meloidogyne enterolobii TaxID=390850 RepID=A0A6V7XTF1_MELEN|nr:unnamed protein product [Meloidogyne enterolobii]CAD2202017.1 unnamed protein product [Meloidogyne enterolobii]
MEKQQKINLKNNLYLQICLYFHFRLLPFILFSQIICFGIKVFFVKNLKIKLIFILFFILNIYIQHIVLFCCLFI